eukprot:3070047-Rhodomonas_salina.1
MQHRVTVDARPQTQGVTETVSEMKGERGQTVYLAGALCQALVLHQEHLDLPRPHCDGRAVQLLPSGARNDPDNVVDEHAARPRGNEANHSHEHGASQLARRLLCCAAASREAVDLRAPL